MQHDGVTAALKAAADEIVVACRSPRTPGTRPRDVIQRAIDDVSMAALVTDERGKYLDVNRRACTLTGFSESELLSRTVWDLTGSAHEAEFEPLWRAFLRSGSQTGEYALKSKDGQDIRVVYYSLANILPGFHLTVLQPLDGAALP